MLSYERKVAIFQYYYIVISLLMILILAVISAAKGNEGQGILVFLTPLLFLSLMPILSTIGLVEKHLLDGIMKHFLIGTLMLSVFIIVSAVLSKVFSYELVGLFLDKFNNYGLMFLPGSGTRVSVQTGVLLPSGLLISLYLYIFNQGVRYLYYSFVIIFAIFFTKTFGIWAGTIVAILVMTFLFMRNKVKATMIILLSVMVLFVIGNKVVSDARSSEVKNISFLIKEQQLENGLKSFYDNPLIGNGIGSIKSLDDRGWGEFVVEVVPIMILVDGGLIGSVFYIFIYLVPFFLYIKQIRYGWGAVIFPAHLSILVAGLSNPYFISGSVGLFFVVMLFVFVSSRYFCKIN